MFIKNIVSIFFLILCLSSCDSVDEKKLLAEEHIFDHYTTKYPEIFKDINSDDKIYMYFFNDTRKIKNIKQAMDFLGKPSKKIRLFLDWKLEKPSHEYVELWEWEKPFYISALFNLEGKMHDKIQLSIISDSVYDKYFEELKDSPLGMTK